MSLVFGGSPMSCVQTCLWHLLKQYQRYIYLLLVGVLWNRTRLLQLLLYWVFCCSWTCGCYPSILFHTSCWDIVIVLINHISTQVLRVNMPSPAQCTDKITWEEPFPMNIINPFSWPYLVGYLLDSFCN